MIKFYIPCAAAGAGTGRLEGWDVGCPVGWPVGWPVGRLMRVKVKIRDWYQVKDIRWEKKKRGRNRVIQNGIHWIWYDIMHYSFESPSSKYIQMHRARTEQSRAINIEIWSVRTLLDGKLGDCRRKGGSEKKKKNREKKIWVDETRKNQTGNVKILRKLCRLIAIEYYQWRIYMIVISIT